MVEPSPDQIRWNQLRKQHLLSEKPKDFYELIKAQLGLHSTDYWTPYFSVWARLGDFDAKNMFDSLNSGKELVRTHAFRTTVHVMHVDNLPLVLSATGPSLYRAARKDRFRKTDLLSDSEIEHLLATVKNALQEGPMQMSELKRAAPEAEMYMRSTLIMLMAKGEVVRATASHARNNLTTYALMSQWLGQSPMKLMDEREAIAMLIGQHIARFGPASIEDIAWWLRVTKMQVKKAIAEIGDAAVSLGEHGQETYMMREDFEIASSLEISKEGHVWFLPYEDHFLKAFIDRSAFVGEDIQPKLFPADRKHFWPSAPDTPLVMPSIGVRTTGEVRPSIWLDGEVVGRWEIDEESKQKKIVTSLYRKIAKDHQRDIEQAREQLEAFVNNTLQPISGG
jgi:hypothetical protein